MKTRWKELAASLPDKTLNPWGQRFERTLKELNPQLAWQLSQMGDLKPFLLVQQNRMMDEYQHRIEKGEDPNLVRESLIAEFSEMVEKRGAMEQSELTEDEAESVVTAWLASQEA